MQFDGMTLELVLRVLTGFGLGAAVGLERQWRSRLAGIRTNALVAGGSALFVVLSAYGFGGDLADPTRVAAQVVSGIGFLGAGVIMREGVNVRGLNTAATLWCAAAIGCLAGAGLYLMACLGAVAVIATNTLLRPVSRAIRQRRAALPAEEICYLFEIVVPEKNEQLIRGLLMQSIANASVTLHSMSASKARKETVTLRAALVAATDARPDAIENVAQRLSLYPKVRSVRWWVESDDDDQA